MIRKYEIRWYSIGNSWRELVKGSGKTDGLSKSYIFFIPQLYTVQEAVSLF